MMHDYLFLFHVQYAVKKLQQRFQQDKIPSEIIDVPRKLSSECELGILAHFINEKSHESYVDSNIRAIYKVENKNFTVIWQDKS
ncbi:putative Se/S carrier-like protein [Proteus hauseri]|uniref:putative Se/S carrier-like protein n=1 Tax=Proteus hauseri TaxID=183417 RepID=UPI0032D9CFE1